MAKSRPSFGDQVSKGIRDTYSKSKVPAQPPESAEEKPGEQVAFCFIRTADVTRLFTVLTDCKNTAN